jgi:CHAT domain-containing protein
MYLYEMLIPKNLNKNIGNLIIVPDGVLATIPFETLLTSKVADTTQFQNLPYLVKKYSISYCSSATLFKETFAKKKGGPSEVRPLNEWIAYAPVFDDENSQGTSLASRALIRELHKLNKDSTLTRGLMMGTGESVPPLPGSENEVKSIFNEFDKQNFKTTVELKGNASEKNIKSGELQNYKYIHLATHGFVNSEKPELSGLLLAQVADSTNEQNDGILYSGEIFNLKLNADLVVLSACETGLGQIKKGEGIIGLTRALLYAGAKNLMVSLWPVSDESTSDLMIDFYKNLLSEKSARLSNSVRFAPLLQQAKLKMISEEKFARPYFWSPFILIGQ